MRRLLPPILLVIALAACRRDSAGDAAPLAPPTGPMVRDATDSPSGTAPAPSSAAPQGSAASGDSPPVCADLAAGGPAFPRFPQGHAVRGIDASTDVAWAAARAGGVSFAILQATMGNKPNEAFLRNFAMAKACGVPRGAYHFMSPRADPVAQADLFVHTAGELGELTPIVDVELVPGCKAPCCDLSCDDWKLAVSRTLERVEKQASVRPYVYTVDPFWKECLCNTSRFAEYKLWLAGFPRFDASLRPGFGGWQRWVFYQSAGNAKLGGGVVDADVFRGDKAAFDALLDARRAERAGPSSP